MVFDFKINGVAPTRRASSTWPCVKLNVRKPSVEQCREALRRTYGVSEDMVARLRITEIIPIREGPVQRWANDVLTIPGKLSDGTKFYYAPGETAVISVVRNDPNNNDPPLVDLVTVPRQLTDGPDYDEALRDFFGHVLYQFFKHDKRAASLLPQDPMLLTWDHFFNLPEDYLETKYSVKIRPVESMLSLELNRDETPPVA